MSCRFGSKLNPHSPPSKDMAHKLSKCNTLRDEKDKQETTNLKRKLETKQMQSGKQNLHIEIAQQTSK